MSNPKYPNNIKKVVEKTGLSLRTVSRLTTIPYSTLYKMANGILNIHKSQYNILYHLARFLGCEVIDFFEKEGGIMTEKISHEELKSRFRELFETLELEKEKEREYHGFYIDENGKVRHTDENLKGEENEF